MNDWDWARTLRAASLFARRRDGSPTGWPMTPLWPGDGHLYFNTYRTAAKAKLMMADQRIGVLLFDDGGDALALQADAQLLTEQAEIEALAPRAMRIDGFTTTENANRTLDRLLTGKRVMFRVVARSSQRVNVPRSLRQGGVAISPAAKAPAGRDRNALALDDGELAQFLAAASSGVASVIDEDGYPTASPVATSLVDGRLHVEPALAAGRAACVVVDRGVTYSDIVGVVVRGAPDTARALPLDDVVSFAFAKLAG